MDIFKAFDKQFQRIFPNVAQKILRAILEPPNSWFSALLHHIAFQQIKAECNQIYSTNASDHF